MPNGKMLDVDRFLAALANMPLDQRTKNAIEELLEDCQHGRCGVCDGPCDSDGFCLDDDCPSDQWQTEYADALESLESEVWA